MRSARRVRGCRQWMPPKPAMRPRSTRPKARERIARCIALCLVARSNSCCPYALQFLEHDGRRHELQFLRRGIDSHLNRVALREPRARRAIDDFIAYFQAVFVFEQLRA